jgi:hypothetical protein
MRLALNMAKTANRGFLHTAIEETQCLIKKPHAEIQGQKKHAVEFPGHKKVKAVMERHPAMLCQDHTPGCLPCQNGTANILQKHWTYKGTGAAPPN